MTTQDRIKQILTQPEYKVVKGKIKRQSKLDPDSWDIIPANKAGEYYLYSTKSGGEMFKAVDVEKVMDALQNNGKPPEAKEKEQSVQEYMDSLPIQVVEDKPYIKSHKNKAGNIVTDVHEPVKVGKAKFERMPDFNGVKGAKLPEDYLSYDKTVTVNREGEFIENVASSFPAGIEQYGTIPKAKKSVKPKVKDIMKIQKAKTVKGLKKVIKEIEKTKSAKKVKVAKKASTRKPYPTGENRASLSEKDLKFISDNYKTMSINKIALKFGVGRLTVGHHVRKLKNGKK